MEEGKVHSELPGTGYDRCLSFEWEKKWEPELDEPEVAFPVYIKVTRKSLQEVRKGKARES